jgi:hypothetical protein
MNCNMLKLNVWLHEIKIGNVANQIGTLQQAEDTRWSSHFQFVCS